MNIKAERNILDNIEIASPCTVSWESMDGDAITRHCSQCKLSVYNISEMSKKDAEKLIQENEGRLCVRLYKRFDGTIITNDCPVALRKIQQSLKFVARAAAAVLSLFLGFSAVQAQDNHPPANGRRLMGKIRAVPRSTVPPKDNKGLTETSKSSPPKDTHVIMGNYCAPKPSNKDK